MKRSSIAWRLAIGLTLAMVLIWLGAVAIAGSVMQNELNASFDESLQQSAFRLLPLATHDLTERDRGEIGDHDEPPPVGVLRPDDEYFTYYVRDRDGNIVVRAEDAPADLPLTDVPDGFSYFEGQRVFATTDARTGYGIVVIERSDHRPEALAKSLAALIWPLAALVPLIGLGIWYGIRLAMRPVLRLSRDIASRDRRNLAPLDAAGQPVELAPIAEAVASLIDRLRAALDAERAFAASSAHELRTPIAGALAQTQQLAIELGDRPGIARVREIETALKHLSQLSERLLQLSRLDAGFAQSDVVADLLPALRLVVHDFQANGAGSRVNLQEHDATVLKAPVNLDAFAVAVRNLIQNALVHGAADGPVDVHAGPGAMVRVVNQGAVVPPEVLAHLDEPFIRGATSAQGSGLGLSIVRAIVDQTGGTLTFRSPATDSDEGFEAVMDWGRARLSPAAARW